MSDNFDFSSFINPVSGMRFQSQLGKQMERRYKKGQNVVKLSMARVVKVNYKYNTVDVVTTLYRNSTVKNPADEGRFSAKLPVAFGGTTPEGKTYGSNTLVTVGSLVLLGFLEGNKDHPIVLNIYGDADNQSRLTRTTYPSADESQEDIQRELWQLFTLYPSMTYKNIDGNGNQEVTFSGKTFLISTDTDPENDYINDAEFDYDLLPNARYADGELIEPKSPEAPTVLYVHQGIYGKHRLTFFIKADGTMRIGSRHSSGEGITFMELGTDGAFRVSQKRDTTNPESESEKFSSLGIEDNGAVALESANHRLEVNEEGVFVDGKSLATFIGGGSGDGDDDDSLSFDELIDEFKKVQTELSVVSGEIKSSVKTETYTKDLGDINSKVAEVESNIADVTSKVNSVGTPITYSADIVSTNGIVLGAGETSTILFCNVKQSNDDITSTLDAEKFIWTRVSDSLAADTAWNAAHATGVKSITITQDDVNSRAIFNCDVVTNGFDVTAQIEMTDASETPIIDDTTKLNRYRRAIVRADLAVLVGRFLDKGDSMPTLAQLDLAAQGQVYTLRKDAKNAGMATLNTLYVNYENAYNGLKTYLEAMSPKPWDTTTVTLSNVNATEWNAKWDEYRLRYTMLNVEVEKRKAEYADSIGQQYIDKAIQAVSSSEQFETKPLTNPTVITSPIASIALPEFQGRHIISSVATGNKIVPVTSPSFTSGSTLTIYASFYGDGAVNDTFSWDKLGRAIKIKYWEDNSVDGTDNWEFSEDRSGYKIVKLAAYSPTVTSNSVLVANFQKAMLTTVGTITAYNQVKLQDTDRTLYISLKDTDTGWGENYTPSTDEIKAYFNGWVMCNGTFGTPFAGTGSKVWYPIGSTDLSQSTMSSDGTVFNPVPTAASASLSNQLINPYQIVHRLADAIQETVQFDGILPLIIGDNNIDVTYPADTPEILNGYIRYALNLATVTDTLKYIIPVLQKRIAQAEETITDEAITSTVMNSIEYQFAMTSKADKTDLTNYPTKDEVAGQIQEGLGSLDFEPYVTQSQLIQRTTDLTAMFSTGGGVNTIKNSIGFSGTDFWDSIGSIETISNIELDTLGFGSGFLFNPDGQDKEIVQELDVIPNQPYTLSWYLNKRTAGPDDTYRLSIEILENEVITTELGDNSDQTTVGYLANNFTFTPQAAKIKVKFKAGGHVDATLTGAMLVLGELALKWSLATGEVYNTNVRMDIRGIRVSQLDANKQEVGFTQITPEEFAGYHKDETGEFKKVFYQNGDETVAAKLRAEQEINMGAVKILNVNSGGYNGWAIVANLD